MNFLKTLASGTLAVLTLLLKLLLLSLLVAGVAIVAVWGWSVYQQSEAAAPPVAATAPASRVHTEGGLTVVTLDAGTQKLSGLESAVLNAAGRKPEQVAYGSVLDIQPLIDLQARYLTATADIEGARAEALVSGEEADRSRLLFQHDKSVALKIMQTAEATAAADHAKLRSAEIALQAVRAGASQQFGPSLSKLLGSEDPAIARLLDQEDTLLRIALPLGGDANAPARISVDDGTHGRINADLVSPSPQSDPTAEGPTFLYRVTASLSAGSKVVAYLPTSESSTPGVIIPSEAVLWFGGQPWVYVAEASDRFVRRPLQNPLPYDNGFFVGSGFKAGERVLTRGAQLLLSEEQRPPVTSVAACKDPECDD